ncbi:MAG TPA: hypothetical protein DCS71_03850 [Flavobacteriales bacterium]|nr:hypothetical protein [Flavobacteriales bacterium]
MLTPNPARDQVWIRGLEATDLVQLLDAGGRQIDVDVLRQGSVSQLELGTLAPGIYHVVVTALNGVVTSTRLAVQ